MEKGLEWQNEFPDLELPDNIEIDPLDYLLKANMGSLMKKIITSESKRKNKSNKIPRYDHLQKKSISI